MRLRFEIELNRPRIQVHRRFVWFEVALLALVLAFTGVVSRVRADMGTCNGQSFTLPFNDVAGNPFFCFIAEVFFLGITSGNGSGGYGPNDTVTRGQMAVFLDRTVDQSLRRGSLRAALDQWWTPQSAADLQTTTVGNFPQLCKSDGDNIWVANQNSNTISRVSRVTGDVTGTWTGANGAFGILVAKGQVFITGLTGTLYSLDPSSAPGAVATVTSGLGNNLEGISFDGSKIWVASRGLNSPGSVSAISLNPVSVQTFTADFSKPTGVVFDGTNIWVTDDGDKKLKKLNSDGTVALSATFPSASAGNLGFAAFDGTNIWVPTSNSSVFVVRAVGGLAGTILAVLTMSNAAGTAAAFDGERVLVTGGSADNVFLWKAADLTPLGSLATGGLSARGVCSDGINFWITLSPNTSTPGLLARF